MEFVAQIKLCLHDHRSIFLSVRLLENFLSNNKFVFIYFYVHLIEVLFMLISSDKMVYAVLLQFH